MAPTWIPLKISGGRPFADLDISPKIRWAEGVFLNTYTHNMGMELHF